MGSCTPITNWLRFRYWSWLHRGFSRVIKPHTVSVHQQGLSSVINYLHFIENARLARVLSHVSCKTALYVMTWDKGLKAGTYRLPMEQGDLNPYSPSPLISLRATYYPTTIYHFVSHIFSTFRMRNESLYTTATSGWYNNSIDFASDATSKHREIEEEILRCISYLYGVLPDSPVADNLDEACDVRPIYHQDPKNVHAGLNLFVFIDTRCTHAWCEMYVYQRVRNNIR